MKARFINKIILEKAKSSWGRIIVLTGARQTGKTTLARKSFGHYEYISIEDPVTRGDYSRLTAQQWKALYPFAILDEVQKEPSLIESIKSVYDQYENPRYVLLGSSQILLLDKVRESLAGRCLIFEIFPLTIPELLTRDWEDEKRKSFFQNFIEKRDFPVIPPSFQLTGNYASTESVFHYYLEFGAYPALTEGSLSDTDRRDWLQNYVRTYLERDIRDLVNLRDLEPFVMIQKTTAILTGQTINFSQLAREAGVSSHTAQRYLRYLEISRQAFLLPPWAKNPLKRLSKSPKIHFMDPGVQRAILKKQGYMTGLEFESAIVAEIFKQLHYLSVSYDLYHLRTSDGREIDLLIELEDGYIAIEIKQTQKVSKTHARHLIDLDTLLDKPVIRSFILSNDNSIREIKPNIWAMPAAFFLS